MREGAFDPSIREFTITDSGIVVGQPFEGVEAILSGMAREAARIAAVNAAAANAAAAEDGDRSSSSGDTARSG